MSGVIPQCSQANIFPDLPSPVGISSKINNAPCSLQAFLTVDQNPGGGIYGTALAGSAITAAMIFPDKKVISVCGDGGFMMNSQELETAVRLGVNLTVVILNDKAYGMVKWKQENMSFSDFGLSFENPDFVKYADAYGAKGYRIDNSENLTETLESCLNSPGVHVIDCPIDYSENDKILNKDLQRISSAL